MELLRQELSNTIAGLVAGRQSKAISEASFSALVDGLAKSHDSSRTELIRASLGEVYINAKQGSLLLELIEDDFDQVRDTRRIAFLPQYATEEIGCSLKHWRNRLISRLKLKCVRRRTRHRRPSKVRGFGVSPLAHAQPKHFLPGHRVVGYAHV